MTWKWAPFCLPRSCGSFIYSYTTACPLWLWRLHMCIPTLVVTFQRVHWTRVYIYSIRLRLLTPLYCVSDQSNRADCIKADEDFTSIHQETWDPAGWSAVDNCVPTGYDVLEMYQSILLWKISFIFANNKRQVARWMGTMSASKRFRSWVAKRKNSI